MSGNLVSFWNHFTVQLFAICKLIVKLKRGTVDQDQKEPVSDVKNCSRHRSSLLHELSVRQPYEVRKAHSSKTPFSCWNSTRSCGVQLGLSHCKARGTWKPPMMGSVRSPEDLMQALLRWSEDRDHVPQEHRRKPDDAINGIFRSTSSFCMEIVVATWPRGRVNSLGGSASLRGG